MDARRQILLVRRTRVVGFFSSTWLHELFTVIFDAGVWRDWGFLGCCVGVFLSVLGGGGLGFLL